MIDWTNLTEVTRYLRAVAKNKDPLRHQYYNYTVNHAKHLAVHVRGDSPGELLFSRRPNEPKEVLDYRLKIWKPITKSRTKKIINVLARIKNAKNYYINYPTASNKVKNQEYDESLEAYVNNDYPYFESYLRWVFDIGIKQMVSDPNAVLAFYPTNYLEMAEDDTMLPTPFGKVFYSHQVVDYSEHHYTFFKDEKSWVKNGDNTIKAGNIFCVYTTDKIIEYVQYGEQEEQKYEEVIIYQHDIGYVPVLTLGGEYVDNTYPFVYESFISGVLPYFDDAVREYSDKQAVFVQHVYLERVEMAMACDNPECGAHGAQAGFVCDGERKGNYYKCSRCKGEGSITGRSPFGVTKIKQSELNPIAPIFPGVQYVDKPTEIVQLLKDDIDDLINDGYASLNMEFLSETPEAQSGVAKAYDRAELTSYLLTVSNNVFDNIIKNGIWIINQMRYNKMLSHQEVDAQMPTIVMPSDFDIQSLNEMIADFARNKDLPEEIKSEFTLEIVGKKFAGDTKKQDFYKALVNLDPLRGKTSDEKFTAFSNGVITKEDYIISENLFKFLSQLSEADDEFFQKAYEEQYKALLGMAAKQNAINKKIEIFEENK